MHLTVDVYDRKEAEAMGLLSNKSTEEKLAEIEWKRRNQKNPGLKRRVRKKTYIRTHTLENFELR